MTAGVETGRSRVEYLRFSMQPVLSHCNVLLSVKQNLLEIILNILKKICQKFFTIGEKHVRKPKIWKNDTHSVRMA
jgi:hypothetical protein